MDYEYALKYPAKGDWTNRILIGSGLLIAAGIIGFFGYLGLAFLVGIFVLPLALVPRLLTDGYYVRVLRRTSHGDMEPPEFSDPGALAADGLRLLGIKLAYFSPLILLGGAAFGISFASIAAFPESEVGIVLMYLTMYIGMPILGMIGILVNYVASAGAANFAYEDDLMAAFDTGVLREVLTSKTWVIAFVIAWGVSMAAQYLSLGGLGYLLLIGFVVEFYVSVVGACIHGQAIAEIRGEGIGDPGSGDPADQPEPAAVDDTSWERVNDGGGIADDD